MNMPIGRTPEQPVALELVADEGRAKAASRVHRRAGQTDTAKR